MKLKVFAAPVLETNMKSITAFLATFLFLTSTAFAQDASEDEDVYGWNQRHKATQVVLSQLTYGNGYFAPACQEEVAPMGCERRVNSLVGAIFTASRRHHLDPWAMVALAFETTHFNPFNTTDSGFTGVMGIPMEVTFRRHSPFFVNPVYRGNCRNQDNACQVEIIEHSVERIAATMSTYRESLGRTLQRYSEQHIPSSRARFSRHVLRRARNFRVQSERVEDIDICRIHPMVCSR